MFLKCLIKTIVCSSIEAAHLGLSPRLLEVARHYLGTREIFLETGSLRLHLRRDQLEVLNFHVDSATGSKLRMLNCWLPMNRVLPGQEIRMVPLSHRIGARGRQLFEALPERLKLWLSTGIDDYEPRDAHMWSGNTEHGRVLNRHMDAAIAVVFRYAEQPLNPDWRPVDAFADRAPAVSEGTWEIAGRMTAVLSETVERIRSSPSFSPIDCLRVLQSPHLISHPDIGRQLALCFIYYCERAGREHAVVDRAALHAAGPVYWPEHMVEIYLLLGQFYLQQGMMEKARQFLTETVKRTAPDQPLLDKVVRLRSAELIEAMVEVHGALGMAERAARFAGLRETSPSAT